jgi:hypothetical protein
MAFSLEILHICPVVPVVCGLLCKPSPFYHSWARFLCLSSVSVFLWGHSWTIRNGDGSYGEIDIIEGFSDITNTYTTLHTDSSNYVCTFNPPSTDQTGTSNQGSTDCGSDIGCSVIGVEGSYGTPFNQQGGGVYAMEWTSNLINIFYWPRDSIPADITAETPDPTSWGTPMASYESQYGNCDIDNNFPTQTIVSSPFLCLSSFSVSQSE